MGRLVLFFSLEMMLGSYLGPIFVGHHRDGHCSVVVEYMGLSCQLWPN